MLNICICYYYAFRLKPVVKVKREHFLHWEKFVVVHTLMRSSSNSLGLALEKALLPTQMSYEFATCYPLSLCKNHLENRPEREKAFMFCQHRKRWYICTMLCYVTKGHLHPYESAQRDSSRKGKPNHTLLEYG